MEISLISPHEAYIYLEHLKGLPITQIIIDDTGCLCVDFGQIYKISNISYGPNGPYEKTQTVAHYRIKSHLGLGIMDSSGIVNKCNTSYRTNLSCFSRLIGIASVNEIHIHSDYSLEIVMNNSNDCLIINPGWDFCQPCTEEDVLSGTRTALIKSTRLSRRWSNEFPYHRDKWHTF